MSDNMQVIDVSAHHGRVLALDAIGCSFPAGRITALTGGNGSGKSTLIAVLAGLHRPTRGQLRRPPGGVALVRQSWSTDQQLPLTVTATVSMGRWHTRGHWRRLRSDDRALVRTVMEQLDVADLGHRQLGALSGGQRQRVLVAQALAQRSGVLLLDEPTAGVDAAARERIEDVIAAEAERGVVVVHVTHDPDSVRRAHHHLHLDAGRVAHAG